MPQNLQANPSKCDLLVDVSRRHAEEYPERRAFAFLTATGSEEAVVTYADLDRRARSVAGWLQHHGMTGERALLLLPTGIDYVAAFLGCLYAGTIAVPAYPPRARGNATERLDAILADAEPRCILTTAVFRDKWQRSTHGIAVEAVEAIPLDASDSWSRPQVSAEDLAFLQYTSGSTGTPRGVAITHTNLVANETTIQQAFGVTQDSVICGWLPLYHDMGLVGCVLQPVYTGAFCVLMSPGAFIQRPARWLRAISNYRANISGAPSFAYDLCVQRVTDRELENIDLSSWTVAFNGAEPVRATTLRQFSERFGAAGFRRSAWRPCYGLAESTLLVSVNSAASEPSVLDADAEALHEGRIRAAVPGVRYVSLVSCGGARNAELAVVDPETLHPRVDGEVGELWLKGASIAAGYWRRPDETASTFKAELTGHGGTYLRTGDLGFTLNGELFITGRSKDVIILDGRNYYPQDFEATVQSCHPALRSVSCAAIPIQVEERERLAIVCETDDRYAATKAELIACIHQAVSGEHEQDVWAIALVARGSLPRTTSGKIRRASCHELLNSGRTFWKNQPKPEVCEEEHEIHGEDLKLRREIACILNVPVSRIDPDLPLTRLGLDSIRAVEVAHAVERHRAINIKIHAAQLLDGCTLRELVATSTSDLPVHTGNVNDTETPLSANQEALYVVDRANPLGTSNHIAAAAELHGQLGVEQIQHALEAMARTHEILRTRIHTRDGSPYQNVVPDAEIPLRLTDAAVDQVQAMMQTSVAEPFDLEKAAPLRLDLYRLASERHVLLLTIHHIVADLWSLTTFFQDLLSILGGGIAAQPSRAGATYRDFVEWQRAWMSSEEGREAKRYWDDKLSGHPAPVQFPRPGAFRDASVNLTASLSAPIGAKVRALARKSGTTPFGVYSSALAALMCRYGGQEQVDIGVPVSGRPGPRFEATLGCFVNVIPVRADCSGNPSSLDLMRSLHREIVPSLRHCYLPLSHMSQNAGRGSGDRYLNVVLAFQSDHGHRPEWLMPFVMGMEGGSVEAGRIRFESMRLDFGEPSHDLVITLGEMGERVLMRVQAKAGVLPESLARALPRHFETLLGQMLENPERGIRDLRLATVKALPNLSGSEKAASPACLHTWFEQVAERREQAIAVTAGSAGISYACLNTRANRLARVLRRMGCVQESLVSIYLDRSIEMVTAILAVLKAGGGYVPLDPSDNSDRIAHILRDSKCKTVITTGDLAESPCLSGVHILRMDATEGANESEPDHNLDCEVDPDNVAYVIYTSGSTGLPKGCVITHANVTGLFASTEKLFSFDEHDVSTVFHSFAFDFSVWELWSALLYGGRAVIVPYWISRSADELGALLRRERVTCLSQTPTAFRELLLSRQSLAGLRLIVFGGEELPFSMLRDWSSQSATQPPKLVNMYGITETTVHVTYREITAQDAIGAVMASMIGHALPDMRLYVLDEYLQVVPPGITGELYVAGRGLARGYLDRAALTSERYLPNPFGLEPGERLYRTGDLGRYDENGDVEYLGRRDRQVQLRGFRVEPGEIEACLGTFPGVSRAVVISQKAAKRETVLRAGAVKPYGMYTGKRRRYLKEPIVRSVLDSTSEQLVAYLCPGGGPISTSQVDLYLRKRLPMHMIPSAIMLLDELPTTSTGKLDRSRLPAPEIRRLEGSTEYQPPRTSSELELAAIWSEVLDIKRIGVTDNFFALGGDSVRAIRVIGKAEVRGLRLSVADIFNHPTLEELAAHSGLGSSEPESIEAQPFAMASAADLGRLPEGIVDMYPLSRMQAGLLFHSDQYAGSPVYRATFLYRLKGTLEDANIRQAIADVARRHPILRTSFDLTRFQGPMQLVHADVPAPVRFVDLSTLSAEEQEQGVENWFEEERSKDFDLCRAPLFRFTVHRLSGGEFTLGLTCHDAILDGWSTSSLLAEVLIRSARAAAGEPLPIAAPSVTFAQFVQAERQALNSEPSACYWQGKTAEWSYLHVPGRRSRSEGASPEMAVLDTEITQELSDRLIELARREHIPLKNLLLAAHLCVLRAISGLEDISTGLEVNGRLETAGAEECLGQHLNTVPFRLRLSGGTWLQLIQETLAAEREMLPHRRFAYAEIQKRLGAGPLYETTFNYTHFHVFEGIGNLENLEILAGWGRELTHYVLKTEFNRDAFTNRLHLDVIYDGTELAEHQVRRIGAMYVRALSAIASTPSARYEQTDLLAEEERERVLRSCNNTDVGVSPQCLHELIEATASVRPEAVAVVFENETLTYRELNDRANRLARRLRHAGLKQEAFAGVYMDRSIDLIPALLAVLKTGAAFLPLDAEYPDERIRYMLQDSGVRIVLTHSRLLHRVPEGLTAIALDAQIADASASSAENLGFPIAPDNAIYMIYTSGSTGSPKGAVNTHAGVVNRLQWMQSAYGFCTDDRVLQKTPVSFDVSVWELFLPLLCGGCVVVARPGGHRDPEYLAQVIERHQITTVHFVPSMLRAFLEQDRGPLSTLKRVICSGEELTSDLVALFFQKFSTELHNLYGPTEAAVDVSAWACVHGVCEHASIPIGLPIWNTQLFILNSAMQPCGIGVPGELYIGGIGVGRGYHGRPGLTAEKFCPNPYALSPGERLYRTGDLAVRRDDGAIQFLGRIDAQVKINGVRIEPSEIEATLMRHPNVRHCAVIARNRTGNKVQLAAYIVPQSREEFVADELRAFAGMQLPRPMIPAVFIPLRELPLTPSGKLDRRHLPEPDQVGNDRLEALLTRVEKLSPSEARAQLAALV